MSGSLNRGDPTIEMRICFKAKVSDESSGLAISIDKIYYFHELARVVLYRKLSTWRFMGFGSVCLTWFDTILAHY